MSLCSYTPLLEIQINFPNQAQIKKVRANGLPLELGSWFTHLDPNFSSLPLGCPAAGSPPPMEFQNFRP